MAEAGLISGPARMYQAFKREPSHGEDFSWVKVGRKRGVRVPTYLRWLDAQEAAGERTN